jgi:hypothetical protein
MYTIGLQEARCYLLLGRMMNFVTYEFISVIYWRSSGTDRVFLTSFSLPEPLRMSPAGDTSQTVSSRFKMNAAWRYGPGHQDTLA